MKRPPLFFTFTLCILLSAAVGCARKADDTKISADIQSRYSQDSGLSTKQISVRSVNGVVTISGTVDNTAQRDAASRQASAEPGVKLVVNNLMIGSAPAAATAQPSAAMPAATSVPPASSTSPAVAAKPNAGKASKPAQKKNPAVTPAIAEDSPAEEASGNDQPATEPQPPATPTETASEPPAPPPGPKPYIIDQGTTISVRLIDPIDSEKSQTGDTFHATLNAPLSSDGEEAVPAGVELTGHIVDVKSASKFAGKPLVVLQLDRLSSGGTNYSLQTDQYRKEAKERGKGTAEKVGGGAVLGGIIGAIAGGGKGAAIGAAAGAGAGGAVQAASKSEPIKLPSETVLSFTLQEPITVYKPAESDRQKLGESQ